MDDWLIFLLGVVMIIISMILIVVTKKLDTKYKARRAAKARKAAGAEAALGGEDPYAGLEVGRIYQMENGDIAKYIGDGKFLRVKK
ncbi:MAG TPA: hypothetical protein O0X14_01340 [Methanocorpusculum sp.]|nr:hypothetical protein [Methanocorpusculum sp.]